MLPHPKPFPFQALQRHPEENMDTTILHCSVAEDEIILDGEIPEEMPSDEELESKSGGKHDRQEKSRETVKEP